MLLAVSRCAEGGEGILGYLTLLLLLALCVLVTGVTGLAKFKVAPSDPSNGFLDDCTRGQH